MIDLEQIAHEFALQATLKLYVKDNELLSSIQVHEAGMYYRQIYIRFLHSLQEGQSDLQ